MPKRKKCKSVLQRGSKVEEGGEGVLQVEEGGEGGGVTGEGDLVAMLAEDAGEEEEGMESGGEGEECENIDKGGGGEGVRSVSGDGGSGRGSKRPRIAGLYKPPTHEELRTLKETQTLFQSNLMRLQITELLGEVRPSPCAKLDQFLAALRTTLMSIPSTDPVDLCEAVQQLPPKIRYPINLDPSTVKGKFNFRPPVAVKVVGSYLLKTSIKPELNVDLALQIPVECLQAKDHLNYRYLHKRALYLCHVAAHLRRRKRECGLNNVKFSLSHGGPLVPLLLLVPDEKPQSRYTIRLHTTIPEAPFKPAKLAPSRNNLRPHALPQLPSCLRQLGNLSDETGKSEQTAQSTAETANLPPTPHYNSLVLSEMGGMERHLAEVYAGQQECPAMVDAVMLYRVWARQRGLEQGYGGFTGFHFSLLVVLLLGQRKITSLMSSYQILRVTLQFIASSDWTTAGISMATPDPSLPPLSSFHAHHSAVFLDSTGLLNLLSHISLSRCGWLHHEAATSMSCLDNTASDGFKALFLTPLPFEMKFDLLLHISPPDALYSSLANTTNEEREPLLLDGGSWPLPLILDQVFPVLSRGLGKRVKLIALRPFKTPQWFPSKAPRLPCDSHMTVGVSLDPDHAFSVLDMGPPADSKEAGEFRVFWGEKAELRRFQDGSITEAVVWGNGGGSVGGRRGVVTQVMTHLLNRHAGVPAECVVSSAGVLHPLISLPQYSHALQNDAGQSPSLPATGEEVSRSVDDTLTELSKQLRTLRGLPLAITSIQGANAMFRHSAVFPAMPWSGKTPRKTLAKPPKTSQSDCLYPSCDVATPPFVPALEVVLQLESSGKWPSELTAISHIKTSFYTFLSRALADQCHLLCSPALHHLDVLKGGYVFRLRIHYHRELSILRDLVSAAKPHETAGLKQTLSLMERQLVDRPLLTSILHGLSQQFPAFGAGARLCKRWVSAHLLTNHIADEDVELMVAQLFIQPDPFTPPNSPECVLLRFLSLISTHDWEAEPLIVNLNNELSVADIAEISSQFTSQRSQLPPCYIATPLHRDSSPLTSPSPSLPVLSWARLLARESLNLFSSQLSSTDLATADFKQAFRSPMTGYNALIHLHKKHLPLASQGVDVATTTDSAHSQRSSHGHPTHFPVTDFNPVEKYLAELESAFSEFALFFYDQYGGRYIAVVWKPQALAPQPFKVMQAFCKTRTPAGKGDKKKAKSMFVLDVRAILSDFELMGEGLVSSVEVLEEPPSTEH